ncbi:MAG TPA: hypothetical protein VGV85_13425 [Longimicrobiaceae bacterium]|nr:hypothetical protein [Longimicrobiaceae bacterium]
MGKYGDTAVRAAGLLQNGYKSAEEAWRAVAAEMFPDAPEARRKGCPKQAFLGLCQAGLIRGVAATACVNTDPSLNRDYAEVAVRLLAADPSLGHAGKAELWRRVMEEVRADPEKRHNQQMDVVLTLWNEQLITP